MNTTKPKPLLIGSQTGKKRELSSLLIGAITGSYFRCGSFTHRVGGAVKQNRRGSCGCGFQHNVRG